MTSTQKDKLLRFALIAFGIIFCLVYPVGLVWPSGWVWHGGHGQYYLQMICGVYAVLGIFLVLAARDPDGNRSLISFTIWSSLVHAGIMAVQAIYDGHELGHLTGDVPALLLVAVVLWFLSPARQPSEGRSSQQSHSSAQPTL
jgi:L-lactate permease